MYDHLRIVLRENAQTTKEHVQQQAANAEAFLGLWWCRPIFILPYVVQVIHSPEGVNPFACSMWLFARGVDVA